MKRIFASIIVFSTYLTLFSQEAINKDVKVVSNYAPVVSEATKISILPQIDDTTSQKPTFEYKITSKKLDSEFVTQPISPATLSKEKVFYAPTSFAKLGIGTYSTAFAELYYNILKSEKYAVGLSFDHLSSIGHVSLSNDSLVSAPLHLTNGALNVRRFYKGKTISFDLNFNRTGMDFYGLQTLSSTKNYYLNSKSNITTPGSQLVDNDTQRHSVIDATLGFSKPGGDEKDDSYNGNFRFAGYSNKTGVSEKTFFLNGGLKHFVENFYLEGLASLESNNVSMPTTTSSLYSYKSTSKTTIIMAPRIGFIFSHADIQVGLNLFSQFGDSVSQGFYVGPHLLGKVNLAEGIITAYGGASSKLSTNNYRAVAYENNFIAPDLNVKSCFNGITLFGGVKGNFSSKTSFLAQVDYSSFTDEHFFVNQMYRTTDPTNKLITQAFDYSNRFNVVYDDGKLLSVYGELLVKPSETLDFILSGRYNSWSLSTQAKAWNKPETEIMFKSIFKPWEGWKIQADIASIGERYVYDPTLQLEKSLSSIIDLNLSGEYQYNQRWLIFGGVYNILASKYYKWNEYPVHGFNVRAGVGFTF